MDGASSNGGGAGPRLLAPEAVRRALPASPEAAATVRAARERLASLDDGWLRLAGPDRVVDPESAFACARALRREARALEQQGGRVLVMRTFVEALVRDPLRDGSCDLNLGLATARLLLLRINELGLPCAIEAPGPDPGLVAPLLAPYLEDLVVCQVGVPHRRPRPVRPPRGEVQLAGAPPQSAPAERR